VKVLVVPEDPSLDQYILKPVVERIFSDLGRSPRVAVLSNPRLRGVSQALDSAILATLWALPGMRSGGRSIPKRDLPIPFYERQPPSSTRAKGGPGPCVSSGGNGAESCRDAPRLKS
jgi:hypothetical protein